MGVLDLAELPEACQNYNHGAQKAKSILMEGPSGVGCLWNEGLSSLSCTKG